jgi:hypothetical protein
VDPAVVGWARVRRRPLDVDMFIARVVGHSMEPGIPDGAWGLFRSFPTEQPSATALDERRVVVQLPSKFDPETGAYTLKRWKVTKAAATGEVVEVALRPDNRALQPHVFAPADGKMRLVAEYLETVG